MVRKLLDYDRLIEYLRKKKYKEIKEGEFIVNEDEELAISYVLIIRKGQKQEYREALSQIKKEIEESAGVVEGERKEYGILFIDNQAIFLRRVVEELRSKVVILRKSIDKITPAFEKKLKKLLQDPGNAKYWDELFDRSDIIEEFYKLYIKARENLMKNVKGITDDAQREEFVDNLLMQLLIIWYLQEKGFLNNDPRYLVTKFKEYKNLGFRSYYEFLRGLFEKMMSEPNKEVYYVDDRFGKLVVTGPAPFLDGSFEDVDIPDRVFYIEGKTEVLKRIDPKKIESSDVPILNLFESRDWTEGNIDEFVLGAIFEKLMTAEARKEKGAYYTPEPITEYICNYTIKPYLVDKINEKFGTKYKSLDHFFEEDTDKEHYKFLFEELQNIRILDPACGSGHFLETAINILVEIYEKIWEKAKELGFSHENFDILSVNEKGKIIKESLMAIEDENERKLKLKFHIIISKNIYGVDISPSAIKVSRARLFLSLAKHFDTKNKTHVRFPNVHFNLRVGNSLIGFVDFVAFEGLKRQATLKQFFVEGSSKSSNINYDQELWSYIEKIDKTIGTNAYKIFAEVKDRFDEKLTREILEKVLKLRSDLIRVLLVSLNTTYAVKIKELIDNLTNTFNEKLNNEYIKYLQEKGVLISEDKLKEIGYFHWITEFSDVFLEKGGFDIIIGNPPYGRIKQIIKDKDEKQLYSKLYKTLYKYQIGNFNLYKLFLERCFNIVGSSGYFGMIFPSSFLGENDSRSLRKLFFEKATIKRILEFPEKTQVFKGKSTQAVCILIYNKKEKKDYEFLLRTNISRSDLFNLNNISYLKIKKSELKELTSDEYRIPLFSNPKLEWEILKHISKYPPFKGDKSYPSIGDVGVGHLDETFDKKFISYESGDDLLIKGIHLDRYFVNLNPNGPKPRWIKNKEEFLKKKPEARNNLKYERIIGRNTINKASKPRLRFSLLPPGYVITNAIKFIVLKEKIVHKFYLIALLNSRLLNWRFELFSTQNNIRNYEIESLPIPRIHLEDQKPFIILAKYMIFLMQYHNYFAKNDRHIQYIIDYFDNLLDCLAYELYLGDIVKIPIKSLIEDKLRDFEISNNLLNEDKRKIEKTLNEIKEIFRTLENNKELNENLYLMKLHPWVKQIYSSFHKV